MHVYVCLEMHVPRKAWSCPEYGSLRFLFSMFVTVSCSVVMLHIYINK